MGFRGIFNAEDQTEPDPQCGLIMNFSASSIVWVAITQLEDENIIPIIGFFLQAEGQDSLHSSLHP